jgi:Tannase and feruloyl esterase
MADASQQRAPSLAKLASMYQAQVSLCDGRDGLADGIISHPSACSFDPALIRCPNGTDTQTCLTDGEIEVVRSLRHDLRLANGRTVYSRYGLGSPGEGFGVFMPLDPSGAPTVASFFSKAFLAYLVYNDPNYDPALYDLDRDLPTVKRVIEGVDDFSADTAPLARYLRAGRKVILWRGEEDPIASHIDTIRSFDRIADAAGRDAENARLYTPPGLQHCGLGGPGADRFDLLAALKDWVEEGRAPRDIEASKTDAAGNVLFTRPLCAFPRYPRYSGYGDPNDAASFRCVVGTSHKVGGGATRDEAGPVSVTQWR